MSDLHTLGLLFLAAPVVAGCLFLSMWVVALLSDHLFAVLGVLAVIGAVLLALGGK